MDRKALRGFGERCPPPYRRSGASPCHGCKLLIDHKLRIPEDLKTACHHALCGDSRRDGSRGTRDRTQHGPVLKDILRLLHIGGDDGRDHKEASSKFFFGDEAEDNQELYYMLWEEIAKHYKGNPVVAEYIIDF